MSFTICITIIILIIISILVLLFIKLKFSFVLSIDPIISQIIFDVGLFDKRLFGFRFDSANKILVYNSQTIKLTPSRLNRIDKVRSKIDPQTFSLKSISKLNPIINLVVIGDIDPSLIALLRGVCFLPFFNLITFRSTAPSIIVKVDIRSSIYDIIFRILKIWVNKY